MKDGAKRRSGKAKWRQMTQQQREAHIALMNAARKKILDAGKKALDLQESCK